jgi:hypothetical protein
MLAIDANVVEQYLAGDQAEQSRKARRSSVALSVRPDCRVGLEKIRRRPGTDRLQPGFKDRTDQTRGFGVWDVGERSSELARQPGFVLFAAPLRS